MHLELIHFLRSSMIYMAYLDCRPAGIQHLLSTRRGDRTARSKILPFDLWFSRISQLMLQYPPPERWIGSGSVSLRKCLAETLCWLVTVHRNAG